MSTKNALPEVLAMIEQEIFSKRQYPDPLLVLEPARSIIMKFGGPDRVADLLGRHVTRVRRWTYPREKGGTDGIIPMRQAYRLLQLGPENNVFGMSLDHFVFGSEALDRQHLSLLAMLMSGKSRRAMAKELKVKAADVVKMEATLRTSPVVGIEVWKLIKKREARVERGVA